MVLCHSATLPLYNDSVVPYSMRRVHFLKVSACSVDGKRTIVSLVIAAAAAAADAAACRILHIFFFNVAASSGFVVFNAL